LHVSVTQRYRNRGLGTALVGRFVEWAKLHSLEGTHLVTSSTARSMPEPPMKWAHHPNLRKRPRTPAKGRGSVQRAIKRVFAATSASALTSTQIYDWAHVRRRRGHRKSMPFGEAWRLPRYGRARSNGVARAARGRPGTDGASSPCGYRARSPATGTSRGGS